MRTVVSRIFFAGLLGLTVSALPALGQEEPLEKYIQEGLESNIVLQQKSVSLDKAMLALQTARSMFLPSVGFQFAYQTADGGRNIPLPLGDLLNGAYATLNQLTGTQSFPQLENESITFFPRNFYDAKVRTTVPLINTDLVYNKKLNEQQIILKEYEVESYKRELVKNVKSAYFNYLNALQAINIYQSSLGLAQEGKRMNEKLLENGKGLPAYLLRSNSEIAAVEAQLTQARQQAENAALYFNSLLNRPGDSSIDTSYNADDGLAGALIQLETYEGVSGREELKSLEEAVRVNETVWKMNKSYRVPKLSGFLDVGSQSEGWKFNDQSRYYLAGLQLDIPIFAGNRNEHKIRQAGLDSKDARLNLQNVRQQLDVSGKVARNNLKASLEAYRASQAQLQAAEAYQRLIERGYRAGTNSYIETVDARSQLTAARLSSLINKYNVLLASAGLEREAASYPLNR